MGYVGSLGKGIRVFGYENSLLINCNDRVIE